MEHYKEQIEYPSGIKWTKQRKDVYKVLSEATEPLSAVQIYQHIERQQPDAGYAISTIYRILATFEEQNLVSKTNWMGEDTLVYELNRGHKHYAVCLNCHKRIALQICPFELMGGRKPHAPAHTGDDHHHEDGMTAAQLSEEFQVIDHKLEIYGYCKECQNSIN